MNAPTVQIAALLRWLADQVEAGRAREVEVTRSIPRDLGGAQIAIRAGTLDQPPAGVLAIAPRCRAVYQRHADHVTRVCILDRHHSGNHFDGEVAPQHPREDHHGDGPCAACEPEPGGRR